MSNVVTVPQRQARETARRRAAAERVMADLTTFAFAHGGQFIIFGSAAEGRMTFNSDLDVVVDFPQCIEAAAIDAVEEAGRRHSLPVDVHLRPTCSARFLARINDHMVVLA